MAGRVQPSLRGSLLLSLLTQLSEDHDPPVACCAVRSLALTSHLLADKGRLPALLATALQLLGRPEVAREVEASLLPVLATWLLEQGWLGDRLLVPLVKTLVGGGVEALVRVEALLPYWGAGIIQGCPGDRQAASTTPLTSSLAAVVGSSLLPSWKDFISLPPCPPPWPSLTSSLPLLPLLATSLDNLPLLPPNIASGSSLLTTLLSLFPPHFSLSHLLPPLQHHLDQGALLPMLLQALASCPPLLQEAALPLLTERLTGEAVILESNINAAVEQLCLSPLRPSLLAWVAARAVEPEVQAREQAALLLQLLPGEGLLPSLLLLARDQEVRVVLAALPSLSTLLSCPSLPWEEREQASTCLTSLLSHTSQELVLAALDQVADLLPKVPQEGRDQLLLLPLASCSSLWPPPPSPTLCRALLQALSPLPSLPCSEAVLSGHLLPSLASLLELVQGQHELEEQVLTLMAEVEGSRRRGAGAQQQERGRRDSIVSQGSLGSQGSQPQSAMAAQDQGEESRVRSKISKLLPKQGGISPFWKK